METSYTREQFDAERKEAIHTLDNYEKHLFENYFDPAVGPNWDQLYDEMTQAQATLGGFIEANVPSAYLTMSDELRQSLCYAVVMSFFAARNKLREADDDDFFCPKATYDYFCSFMRHVFSAHRERLQQTTYEDVLQQRQRESAELDSLFLQRFHSGSRMIN